MAEEMLSHLPPALPPPTVGEVLAGEVRRLWVELCAAQGVDPNDKFVEFDPADPLVAAYDRAVITFHTYQVQVRERGRR